MKILGIETSCDETSVAVVEDGRRVLANEIYSQIDIHREYGGVVPEIASRNHVMKLPFIIDTALETAGVAVDDIDAVAVTSGPGLVGALLIGVSQAKAMAYAWGKPLVGVNHIEGHIAANFIEHPELEPPFLALVVSGGHSHLVMVEDYRSYKILGRTVDDAAGEAFDKIARVLGLGYPGGPAIDAAAKAGDPQAIDFPRAKVEGAYNFSFSGLKSAVLNYLNSMKMKNEEVNANDVAASFQEAVIDALATKTMQCVDDLRVKTLVMAGGVSANSLLRERIQGEADKRGVSFYYPSPILCTDNAAMIAAMAYYKFENGEVSALSLNARPSLKIGDSVD